MLVSENKRSFKRRTFLLAAEVPAEEARPLDRAFRFASGVELPKMAPVERANEFHFAREWDAATLAQFVVDGEKP